MNMSSVNRHLSKLSPCWKWDVFADKCPNFSRRMRGCYISSRYPPIRDPALCADQPVRGSTGDTVICCCSQNPVNPGHVSRFVLLSRVTSRDAVMLWSWNLPSPSSFQCVHPRTAAAPVFSSTTSQDLSLTDLCSTFLYLNKILHLWTSTKLYGHCRSN